MNFNINYYNKEFPIIGDIVIINMKEPHDNILESTIEEYPLLRGIMQISNLTNKKRISSIRKFIKKIPVPAEVTDIDVNTKIVSLSRRYIKDIEEKHLKYYQDKLKICNIIKNIKKTSEDNIDDIIIKTLYPLNDFIEIKKNDNDTLDIFNILENNINNLPDMGFHNDAVLKSLNKMFEEKPAKYITTISLICSESINNIIELFNILMVEYPTVKFILESTPHYNIESFGLIKEQSVIHEIILKSLKDTAKKLKITVQ